MTDITNMSDDDLKNRLRAVWVEAPGGRIWITLTRYVRALAAAPADAVAADPVAAAAPELLRMVKWALKILEMQEGRPDFKTAAAEAIAKAEGRT